MIPALSGTPTADRFRAAILAEQMSTPNHAVQVFSSALFAGGPLHGDLRTVQGNTYIIYTADLGNADQTLTYRRRVMGRHVSYGVGLIQDVFVDTSIPDHAVNDVVQDAAVLAWFRQGRTVTL